MRGKSKWILVSVSLLMAACSHGGSFSKRGWHHSKGLHSSAKHYLQKKGRGSIPRYDIPIVINDKVRKWIHYFTNNGRSTFEIYLTRSGRFDSFMKDILREEGVPQDLLYLALIESGFSTHAYSRAKAAGPWQFIRSTGKLYGLKRNWWLDERRDPEKSTRAAARYLKKLHADFGDWYLAMAAYNGGPGRVRRAIKKSRSYDFWKIAAPRKRYLRSETKNYVPKFIAAALIAKNPHRFGFRRIRYAEPLEYETVRVKGPLDLEVAADLIGVSGYELKGLNPELSRGITPKYTYTLNIPLNTKQQFKLAYAQLPPEKRLRIAYHKVRRGESIWKISKRYGVSKNALLAANGLNKRSARRIRPGRRLVIPLGGYKSKKSKPVLLAYNQPRVKQNKKMDGVEWLIRNDSGGSVQKRDRRSAKRAKKKKRSMQLARKSRSLKKIDVSVLDEAGIEQAGLPNIEETDLGGVRIQKKPIIVLPSKKANVQIKRHKVRRGDNLWVIARRHGVRVSDLKRWNKMESNKIRPGKTLVVSKPRGPTKPMVIARKKTYVVRRGDNLWKIARRNGVRVADLKKWNKVAGTKIKPGKSLIVANP